MCWYTRYGSIQLSTYCTDSWSVDRYGPVRRTMLLIKVLSKVMLGIPLLEGTNPASCFPQIVIGSEAVCYSYIWSERYALCVLLDTGYRTIPSGARYVGMNRYGNP
ncbi:hypothetical protein BHE74_00037336 [Ensete ventricosum]|uniref:Uncharacterized protein n=1 Tax=Ensete ventricosum TaxID=4639 RepID=A0A426ZNL0_ENSVE|nr:hypothetical protein B296_00040981 [Ensete ventricosum]RWW55989.1 hypothetical protein BHE74_00037336 [Ensete ventricosum]RZS13577.1 hypothetical protein BHM03_00045179 [Ensete ventricosum]